MRKNYSTDYFTQLYQPNPAVDHLKSGDVEISRQTLLAGA
jgi:hypothetical protein